MASAGLMVLAVGLVRSQTTHGSDASQLAAAVGTGILAYATAMAALSGRRLLADLRGVLPQPAPAPTPPKPWRPAGT